MYDVQIKNRGKACSFIWYEQKKLISFIQQLVSIVITQLCETDMLLKKLKTGRCLIKSKYLTIRQYSNNNLMYYIINFTSLMGLKKSFYIWIKVQEK